MKNILKGISSLFVLLMVFTACSPDAVNHPSESGLPKIGDIQVNITVGEGNVVTFAVENKGVVPIWIFDEDGDITYKAENGYTKVYPVAATYPVEVKVYNSNGISEGSVVKEFTIAENLITEDLLTICGGSSKSWVVDRNSWGHIGCGESKEDGSGDGYDWWAANPGDKADSGMYDDVLTFTIGYRYTYDPGVDGMVHVNDSKPYKPEYFTDNGDYDAPAEKTTTSFYFQQSGDDLYLIFSANTLLPYIPNSYALTTPRYKVMELTDDLLDIMIDSGDIIWRYRFVPKED